MKKPFIWIIMAIFAILAIRVVWEALDEPDEEIPMIANPYNEYVKD